MNVTAAPRLDRISGNFMLGGRGNILANRDIRLENDPTGGTMPRIRRLAPLVVVTALLAVVTLPLQAIGPAILMFYGGDLKEPVLVFPGNPSYNPTSFIWNPSNGGVPYASLKRGTLPPNLEGRRYISVAIFWGRYDAAALRPSDASQHGRIYLGTASAPAVIVITAPRMANAKDPTANPEPVPVPASLDEFVAGWTMTLDINEWIREQTKHAAR
jgi:hypothetical protein